MKERPILFQGEMVRAIRSGSKTQTRRIVKSRKDLNFGCILHPNEIAGEVNAGDYTNCPYGQPGDRLWVRETWMDLLGTGIEHRDDSGMLRRYAYGADTPPGSWGDECRKDYGLKWKPSIHMPRAACRINLEITDIRIELLQEISEKDCWAEGCEGTDDDVTGGISGYRQYRELWESINGESSWDKNPWVWVIEFKKLEGFENGRN